MNYRLTFFSFILLLFACKQNVEHSNYELGTEDDIESEPPRTQDPGPPSRESQAKIIKNGFMQFEVSKLSSAKKTLDSLLITTNAYYENEDYIASSNYNTYAITIRVPNQNFEALVSSVELGVGQLIAKKVNAKNVTEEYRDLNIRLESKLAYLEQYKQILKKAKTIKEILEVQEKIRSIEEEIESKKGRIKYLDDNVKYATLSLELNEERPYSSQSDPSYLKRIATAFMEGLGLFSSFVLALVSIWPFLLLIMLAILGRKSIAKLFTR